MKQKYIKPKLKKQKLKVNLFYQDPRYLDSWNLFDEGTLAFSNTCVSTCLLPDTNIQLANNITKEIQDIEAGDEVLTYDTFHNKLLSNTVKEVSVRETDHGYLVLNEVLKITEEHSIWVNNERWSKAGNVAVGDKVLNTDGKLIEIKSIEHVSGSYQVYNLEIDGFEHNFFADGILVHNQVQVCE